MPHMATLSGQSKCVCNRLQCDRHEELYSAMTALVGDTADVTVPLGLQTGPVGISGVMIEYYYSQFQVSEIY